MLAVVQWLPNTNGFWDVAANWSTGSVPGVNDDVVIDRGAANPRITVRSGTPTVKSIQSTELLALTGGTLTVTQSIQGGTLRIDGGTLNDATVAGSTTMAVTATGGTLDSVTLNSNLNLSAGSGSQVTVVNGLILNGTVTLGDFGLLDFAGTQTLAGSGQVIFQDGSVNAVRVTEEGSTLTIGPNITIGGGSSRRRYGSDW